MNKSAISRWTQELRSGNRAQGTSWLEYVEDGVRRQCCLGVACDLFAEKLNLEVQAHANLGLNHTYYNGQDSVLPIAVADHLGLGQSNPDIILPLTGVQEEQAIEDGKPTEFSIAELNDAGFTFEILADVIDFFLRD